MNIHCKKYFHCSWAIEGWASYSILCNLYIIFQIYKGQLHKSIWISVFFVPHSIGSYCETMQSTVNKCVLQYLRAFRYIKCNLIIQLILETTSCRFSIYLFTAHIHLVIWYFWLIILFVSDSVHEVKQFTVRLVFLTSNL